VLKSRLALDAPDASNLTLILYPPYAVMLKTGFSLSLKSFPLFKIGYLGILGKYAVPLA